MLRKVTPVVVLLLAVMVASVSAQELTNLVAGLSYTVSPHGEPFYENFPESKYAPKLTDGETLPQGQTHNTGYPWLMAFRRPGTVGVDGGVIFELAEAKEIHQVNVSVYANKMAAYSFYNPDIVTVSVSDDGEEWAEVVKWNNPLSRDEHPTGIRWVEIALPNPVKGQFIQVFFTSHTGTSLIFVDEIEVLGR
ncbi:MAG TPA: discoidin domain-containing protein [Firmicutes bacterium]|nr:discoidin domain-containing protein [Bacillota bacterium]